MNISHYVSQSERKADNAVVAWQAGEITSGLVRQAVETRVAGITTAARVASNGPLGDIMRDSLLYATEAAENEDTGAAFYVQSSDVAAACAEAGHPISLRRAQIENAPPASGEAGGALAEL